MSSSAKTETIVVGGGCFWCLEAAFKAVPGVLAVTSGYSGGRAEEADYQSVCSGLTRHAEVVRIAFAADQISLARLLALFFAIHDPTTPDRQGNDVGPQYRSVIFFDGADQEQAAHEAITQAQKRFDAPIVTEVVPLERFYPAEAYHQDYFAKNPHQGYCQWVVAPKVEKMRSALSGVVK